MHYKITHSTTYSYGDAVPVCHNEVYLTPRDGPRQTTLYHRLSIRPQPSSTVRRIDYFGNHLNHFSIHEGHRRLTVTAISRVAIHSAPPLDPAACPPWDALLPGLGPLTPLQLEAMQFRFDSPAILRSTELATWARPMFPPGRSVLDGALELTARIHSEFRYDQRATDVKTRVEEVFHIRRGVCQDFAHLAIGCLRSLGIPARYVSGYLRTRQTPGRPRLTGADASHAWFAVYGGDAGWIDLDPTNNATVAADHVTLAWGRDYFDVCPIKGIYIGGGDQTLSVSVDVQPLPEDAPVEG